MSVTGQTGYIALAKQTAFSTPNTTAASYRAVKITGDSLVASNNMLVAEGEIGIGRDVTQAIPGGFSAAGSINGDLRVRSAAAFLNGALGSITAVTATGSTAALDQFDPADALPVFTVEKKVGSTARSANEQIVLRYSDVMINTLNLSAPSGGLATFAAGLIACGESAIGSPSINPQAGTPSGTGYATTNDALLAFHGGRIMLGDSADGGSETLTEDDTFQSVEVVINNNVQSDEFTVRPSRFLRSLTEGIRSIETNVTLVFTDFHKYQQYTYGASANTTPGYSLYMGAMTFFLGNWQIITAETIDDLTPTGAPTDPQAVQIHLPKLAFSGFPIALSTGRIAVSTTARALKPATGAIIQAKVRPTGAAF